MSEITTQMLATHLAMHLMLGRSLIGRYQIIQCLSAGAFGQTYIAEDLYHLAHPKCVVKHLRQGTSFDPSCLRILRRRFKTEAETLRQLNHERIPQLLASFEEDQEFYLVQEFILGHQLTAELPTSRGVKRWTEPQVIYLLQDVLRILEFVHSQGFIHCDLKPNNLVRRTVDGKLFLIDFGAVQPVRLSQTESLIPKTTKSNHLLRTRSSTTTPELLCVPDAQRLGSKEWIRTEETAQLSTGISNYSLLPSDVDIPGSPCRSQLIAPLGYIPAEQFTGQPQPSSDIYALSLIAIQMLTGLEPLRLKVDFNSGEVIWQHFVPELSVQLAAVLNQMVRYHVKDRYQSATEALQALQALEGCRASGVSLRRSSVPSVELEWIPPGLKGNGDMGSNSPLWMKDNREQRTENLPSHPPIHLSPLMTAVGICLAANSLVFTFGLYSLLYASPSEPTDSSRATPERQTKDFKTAIATAVLSRNRPTAPGARFLHHQARLEAQAHHLLQQAYDQAERRNFKNAISLLRQISPQTPTGAKLHPKLVEYRHKQQIRASYLLQQAYNRAAVSDFTTALQYLKQIPTNTAAYRQAVIKSTEYVHKQHFQVQQQVLLPTKKVLCNQHKATSTAFHPDSCLQEVNTNYSISKSLPRTL